MALDLVVEVESGFVRGVVEKHEEGFDYYSFKGIPYAEPPVGELRFKDPVPIARWTGVMECKSFGPRCLQSDFLRKIDCHTEDCLYLNVYTRSIDHRQPCNPVIVVIHGGGFYFGSGDDSFYGPQYLIRKNVVLVTFNYRLGILGFLDLEDEVAPGNQGLKDQLLVLKWVQRNIRSFGGDPDNVTIFGASAGSASVHYAAHSPLAKGLAHKMISQGCTLYNPWIGFSRGKANAIELCSLLGRELKDPAEIVKFLRSVDAKQLQEAQERLRVSLGALPFGPGIDSKSSAPYVPVHRHQLADEGIHIPCLVGYTAREGRFLLADEVTFADMSREDYFKICNLNPEALFMYNAADVADRYGLTAEQIKRLYFKRQDISTDNLENYVDYAGDFYFVEGIQKFLRVQAELSSAPVYVYQFAYDPPDSLLKSLIKNAPSGAGHLDELPYLFRFRAFGELGIEHFKRGTQRYRIMEQMTEMWANFARYGRPTIEKSELIPVLWQPNNDGTVLRYLNLDEDVTMQSTLNVDRKLRAAKDIKV